MAKRPAFTPDEARAYLARQQAAGKYHGNIPSTDKQAQRVARGVKAGKKGRALYGHGAGESRPQAQVPQRSLARRMPLTHLQVTEWRMGPAPHTSSDPARFHGRIPQPDDLIRLVLQHTSASSVDIMIGVYGYLIHYMDPTSADVGWIYPHILRNREWFLERLLSMDRRTYKQANDPEYLQLAHDLFDPNNSDPQTWVWGWVFQWSVRDKMTE